MAGAFEHACFAVFVMGRFARCIRLFLRLVRRSLSSFFFFRFCPVSFRLPSPFINVSQAESYFGFWRTNQ
jgi:hypothetical protein